MSVVKVNASEPQVVAAYSKPKDDLKVVSRTQALVVSPGTKSVAIVNAGPQGPIGAVGAVGTTNSYLHTQQNTASSWLINHNLGFAPNVTVEQEGTGHLIMCSEIHHSNMQVELQFNTPRAGTARLS